MTSHLNLQGAPLPPSKMNKIIVNYYWASFITFFVEYVRDSANIVYLISCLMSLTEERKKWTLYCTKNWILVTGWGSRLEKITNKLCTFWLTCKDRAWKVSGGVSFLYQVSRRYLRQSQSLLVVHWLWMFFNPLLDISNCITQILLSYTLWRQKHIEIQKQNETQSHKSLQSSFPFPCVNFINLFDIVNNICRIWKVKLVQ